MNHRPSALGRTSPPSTVPGGSMRASGLNRPRVGARLSSSPRLERAPGLVRTAISGAMTAGIFDEISVGMDRIWRQNDRFQAGFGQ